MKCKIIGMLALADVLSFMPFGASHAAPGSTIDVSTITLDQLEEIRKTDFQKWKEVFQDLCKNHPEKMKQIGQEDRRRRLVKMKSEDPERYRILSAIYELEKANPKGCRNMPEYKAKKAELAELDKAQGKAPQKASAIAKPKAIAFKGICGLELGSKMDVSKLKFEEVMNYHGEKVWSKAFHGKVVPPKPIKGLTTYEVFVSAKTHRLFMIKAYADDWAIFNNPMFMFKYKANWAPTPNEILEDPGIVKATEKKYSMQADRNGDQKFFKRKDCGYYQWMLKFGNRIEGFCLDPVKTDWQNDALFGGKRPVVMLAIDTEIEKEAQTEGESYEKDKESNALKAGAAAADEAAEAL